MLELSILNVLLVFVNALLVGGAVAIFYIVKKFGKRSPVIKKDPNYLPRVSIVIPTRNEETIIEERLNNLIEMVYPSELLEVIFVDGSDDATPEIIKKYGVSYPYIKLLKQEKPGFNNALNQGYSSAQGEIVVKSDCDAFPMPNALREIVANFADDRVGAASGVYYFSDSGGLEMESLFRDIQTKVKMAEAYFHSSLISHGGFGAYRKELIPELPQGITADDIELVVNVVKKGYRAIIDPSVKVRNPSPEDFSERRKQLDRRAAGVIRVILKNASMLLNPRFGKFGLITMPVEFFILIGAPILVLVDLALLLLFGFYQPIVAVAALSLVGVTIVSTRFSNFSRTLIDTFISCFRGLFMSYTEKKTWEKEKEENRKELLGSVKESWSN
jgi:cellulose synthase/poly-beta-1,6-N-acetylglucosamine synthase-like glycosyltransferase